MQTTSQSALIRRKEVEKRTALSRSRIYELMKANAFPRPCRLGTMSVAWDSREIQSWVEARLAERDQAGA